MRTPTGLLLIVFLAVGPAQAQVINGEGTYEGSSLHTPPPETVTAETRPKGSEGRPGETKAPRPRERD